ncbi:MAG: phosphotransferase, partial [Actinomycetota bacterium]|nr:phosphotransferase [Actinomycetota bacterium]
LRRDAGGRERVERLLGPAGVVWLSGSTWVEDPSFASATPFWTTPAVGEARAAVPRADEATIHAFARKGRALPLMVHDRLEDLTRRLSRRWPLAPGAWCPGELLERQASGPPGAPPRWLRAVAAESGVDLENHRWGLSAHGRYRSRKVLVFLYPPGGAAAQYVVKLPRHPSENGRIENEIRALTLLEARGLADEGSVPSAVFSGHHGGLALVGESMLYGAPLRSAMAGTPDDPLLDDAVARFTTIALASAEHGEEAHSQVASRVQGLVERFAGVGAPSPDERSFLGEMVDAIAASGHRLPTVFEHGDAGTWNLLARPEGGVAILDWEAAEPHGMPLWDLFYFFRSYAMGPSPEPGADTRLFLEPSALGRRLGAAVADYRGHLGVAPELVAPLFFTCWLHRAMKESTRLPPERRGKGTYRRLLRTCVEQRRSPALASILSS